MNATVEQIQKDLGEYLHRVRDGETVVVFQDDQAVAELRPIAYGPVDHQETRHLRQQRFADEVSRLNPQEEQAMAEDRYLGEVDWPEY